jgi:fructooligosaccharide transport system permease protein
LFSLVVNGSGLWRRILRISFFLPVITSMAVLSVVWSLLYNPTFGAFNSILKIFGFPAQPFLDSPAQAMNCIIVMSVWQGVGFQMMIFLAGLQTIPSHLYEAAQIEGAGKVTQFRYITLPLLKNTSVFVVFITTIFAFKLFVQPHLITHGAPEGSTQTLILQLYNEAFVNGRYGKASAVSVVFFVIVLSVSLIQKSLMPKEKKQ